MQSDFNLFHTGELNALGNCFVRPNETTFSHAKGQNSIRNEVERTFPGGRAPL